MTGQLPRFLAGLHTVAAVAMLAWPMAVRAVEPAKHTVEWYQTHQQARESVLAACQNDHTFDSSGDCRNAQSASHAALADSIGNSGGNIDPEATAAYYKHNTQMIAVQLALCSGKGTRPPQSWCDAAQAASASLHK